MLQYKKYFMKVLLGSTALASSMSFDALAASQLQVEQNGFFGGLYKLPSSKHQSNFDRLVNAKIDVEIARQLQVQEDAKFARELAQIEGDAEFARQLQAQEDVKFARELAQIEGDAEFARQLQAQEDVKFAQSLSDSPVENIEASLTPVVVAKADPKSDLLSEIRGFNNAGLKKAPAIVAKADPKSDLLSEIQGFNTAGLKKALKVEHRPLPIVPALLKRDNLKKADERVVEELPNLNAHSVEALEKMLTTPQKSFMKKHIQQILAMKKNAEEAQQRIQMAIAQSKKEVKPDLTLEKPKSIMEVLAEKIQNVGQVNTVIAQTADQAIEALKEADIDDLNTDAKNLVATALKENVDKLSWFVSQFYDVDAGWEFDFAEADEIMAEMKKSDVVEDDLPVTNKKVNGVGRLNLSADGGLDILSQIRNARGVIKATVESDNVAVNFNNTPIVNADKDAREEFTFVAIKTTQPAKKVVVKILDEGENNTGGLLAAIQGFKFGNLKTVDVDEIEVEKIQEPTNHFLNAMAARRAAIGGGDDESEEW